LLACHALAHLIRAIGHHIDRLACRSVSIMGWPSRCRGRGSRGCVQYPADLQRRPICRVPSQLGTELTRRRHHLMAKPPTPDTIALTVRERVLLFCAGNGTTGSALAS
jgi:hypothetical protein